MSLLLGVDGGATKTIASVVDKKGNVLAVVTSGGANPLLDGETAFDNIRSACESALVVAQSEWDKVAFAFIGMSGVDEPNSSSHRFACEQLEMRLSVRFALDNDGFIAHAGALAGQDGVSVVAGTGAITVGTYKGKRVRVDGMGHWFGDEGSCAWIALQALRACARAQDKRGEPTRLTDVLLRKLSLTSVREVLALLVTGDLTKQELASLATFVAQLADEGDIVAQHILQNAVERLAESAIAALRQLSQLTDTKVCESLPISYIGGVFLLTEKIPQLFRQTILQQIPNANVERPKLPPHLGAVLLSAKHIGWKVDDEWLTVLSETGKQCGHFGFSEVVKVLPHLISEQRNPASSSIDLLEVEDILELINDEDQKVAPVVRQEIPAIAQVVKWSVRGLKNGGRIIYVGAGTSGRLGIMDAAECPPTFGTPPEWVIGIIAGGPKAVFRSVEGAEDDMDAGRQEMNKLNICSNDVVVGLSVSGRTPFVISAMDEAKKLGAKTAAITVNRNSPISTVADVVIAPVVGPEVIAGSTRMKAGTAQKLILNMISTATMVKLNRVQGNLMVDLKTWSVKLRERAKRIVAQLAGVNLIEAEQALQLNDWQVRKALEHIRAKQTQNNDEGEENNGKIKNDG